MRDQFNQWRGKAKTGSMHVGSWIRRHTVLAAVALLLTVLISPRHIQGQVPSPCCAILAAGLGTINSTLGSVIGGVYRRSTQSCRISVTLNRPSYGQSKRSRK